MLLSWLIVTRPSKARGDIATITGHKANVNRKKLCYGARVDEPVCMIDVADSNAVYYYHFDGLGSVVALSDSDGDSVQNYEYSIYGQVAAEDPNHPNPYMFTGRRFDIETGLYYYRARYYNPHIGRFMQTDPVGYADGINWYLYCGNNPVGFVDPSGLYQIIIKWLDYVAGGNLSVTILTNEGGWRDERTYDNWEEYYKAIEEGYYDDVQQEDPNNTCTVYYIEKEDEERKVASGEFSVYITVSQTASFGGTAHHSMGFGIDSAGNIFFMQSGGGGAGSPSASGLSFSAGVVSTDATRLEGVSNQTGGSVVIGGDVVAGGGPGDVYGGVEFQVNVPGFATPLPEIHTIVTVTETNVITNIFR